MHGYQYTTISVLYRYQGTNEYQSLKVTFGNDIHYLQHYNITNSDILLHMVKFNIGLINTHIQQRDR